MTRKDFFVVILFGSALSLVACNQQTPATTASSDETPAAASTAVAMPEAGKEFQDCSDCPVMVALPTGSFTMGTGAEWTTVPHGGPYGQPDEQPAHQVTIGKKFALGKYEVTVGEYRQFFTETNRQKSNTCEDVLSVEEGLPKLGPQKDRSWENPGYEITDKHPVVCVRFEDALAYAAWLSAKTGKEYRLPTEAEWEYAARAGTTTLWSWGDDPDEACKHGNLGDMKGASVFTAWRENVKCDDGYVYTAPVGSYMANPFSLYDMEGNAREWTQDCTTDSYNGAPTDGNTAWTTGGDCDLHIARGGVWFCNLTCDDTKVRPQQINNVQPAAAARPANRDRDTVGFRGFYVGFRLARSE